MVSSVETAPADCLDVLIIEDDTDAATMLCALLESLGHSVRMTTDGVSGLDAARSRPPHLAFVDIGLPGIDGYQVASDLRTQLSADDVQLVAVTGYGRPEDRTRALEAGFDVHMVKPIDFDQIAQILQTRARAVRRGMAS
jgi:CheY-like chemotaxis protein